MLYFIMAVTSTKGVIYMAGRGRIRMLKPTEELEIFELKRAGSTPIEIAYKFRISMRTYSRTIRRVEKTMEKREVENNGQD